MRLQRTERTAMYQRERERDRAQLIAEYEIPES
jgi:hypothetical protein